MSNCAIVGINWGDEGKGRMVDLLSQGYEVVCRYQGGNNAGHTIYVQGEKFVLNLLPSGILRRGVVNVLGPGMVVDIAHLRAEMERLAGRGGIHRAGQPEDQQPGLHLPPRQRPPGLPGGGPAGWGKVRLHPPGHRAYLRG